MELVKVAKDISLSMGLPADSLNSIVVNYYFDGASTYIPAHRDTVSCLEANSRVYCLSLGATRDFLLVNNSDRGKFVKEDMSVSKEWAVGHGDIFGLGQETNTKYCHCVPQDKQLQGMRISVIFRSIDKSFIDLKAQTISVKYANGELKPFSAELITTKNSKDIGTREHIAWLIADREEEKARKGIEKKLLLEDANKYYLGEGETVPVK
jgi:hypothetical protein